jgi:hypothetical protein
VVGESKILTVSYGTFSCTLEGFDDPFSTMKAIAEYFRDLAAEDRYFGAEPPQPDADILHKIAEQTIQSRVNAEVSNNSLILRQDHSEAKSQPTSFAPAVPPTQDSGGSVAGSTAFGSGETISEKLQRIRAVVSRDAAAPLAGAAFFNEDEHADQFGPQASDPGEEEGKIDTAPLADAGGYEDEAEPADAVAEPEPEASSAPNAVGNFLAGLKLDPEAEAVTAQEAELTDEMAEDSVAEAIEAEAGDAQDVEAPDLETQELEAQDVAAQEVDTEHETAEQAEPATSEDAAEAEAALTELTVEDEAAPRRRIVVQKISRAQIEAAQADGEDDSTLANMADEAPDLSEEAEAALMRELASVEADMEAGEAPDMAEADVAELAEGANSEDATIADVMAKQREATAEGRDTVEDASDAEAAPRQGHAALLVEDEDAALNRLMDATSSRMNEDDGAVRRASIAHLKAAVAATKADESIAKAAADEDAREMDQYRDDLARVVRPGRAHPRSEARTPSSLRPAPLVLVSEQRIDEDEGDTDTNAHAAVQPRRLSTNGNLALNPDYDEDAQTAKLRSTSTETFGDYATRQGALELPDLLEAAAAHFTYVEGTGEFTRPMLMRKICSVDTVEAPSREEGLRSFGALLREGKIVKDGSGKFFLAETSRFVQHPAPQEA